jgi:hypothetical protein
MTTPTTATTATTVAGFDRDERTAKRDLFLRTGIVAHSREVVAMLANAKYGVDPAIQGSAAQALRLGPCADKTHDGRDGRQGCYGRYVVVVPKRLRAREARNYFPDLYAD